MKKTLLYLCAFLPLFFYSCDNTRVVEMPSFTITTDSVEYHLGDSVKFLIQGQSNILTFYSGEIGHEYQYRDRVEADGIPKLTFSSTLNKAFANLSLVYSNDLTFDSIAPLMHADSLRRMNAATWTDLNPKFSTGSTTQKVFSDTVVLNKNMKYIAFKYKAITTATQPIWNIKDFCIKNHVSSSASYNVSDSTLLIQNYKVFVADTTIKVATVFSAVNNTLTLSGKTSQSVDNTLWVLLTNLNLRQVQPDLGVNMGEHSYINSTKSFSYKYNKAGSYKATIVGRNITYVADKSKVVEVGVTVK